MASSANTEVSKHTWSTIDFVIAHFLAITWFSVVQHLLSLWKLSGIGRVFTHMVVSVSFLLFHLYTSWSLRADGKNVDIFEGLFTPMVMWVAAGFAHTVQGLAPASPVDIFMLTCVLVLWYAFLMFAVSKLMTKTTQYKWGDGCTDNMAGGAMASAFVLFVHACITGGSHALHGDQVNPPSFMQTLLMLAISAGYIAAAAFLVPVLAKKVDPNKYAMSRVISVVSHVLGVLPYFSCVLSLSHLIVDNLGFADGDVTGQLWLAAASTFVGVGLILLVAKTAIGKEQPALCGVFIGLGGFIVGAAWAGLLDNSVVMMLAGEVDGHPFYPKVQIAVLLTSFILPTYCLYVKPMQKAAQTK